MFFYDSLKINNNKKITVLKSSILDGIEHFFTTRNFVLTQGALTELEQEANQNRAELCKFFNIERNKLLIPQQTHSANIKTNPSYENSLTQTDGLISNRPDDVLLLNFADCVPIIIYDKENNVGSIVHAGWRGTAQKIAINAVDIMQKNFNSIPQKLVCAIGPAIGKCCFCVDEDVFEQIQKSINSEKLPMNLIKNTQEYKKIYVDLKHINQLQLKQAGVSQIDVCQICTSCENDKFFSYRKENGLTARHSAILKINGREDKCQL